MTRQRSQTGTTTEDRLTDERGVLGNLPRSRPGRRSERRSEEGQPAGADRTGGAGKVDARAQRSPTRPHRPPEPGAPDDDLLTVATRAAGGATIAGIRVASKLASGALRRLPRP